MKPLLPLLMGIGFALSQTVSKAEETAQKPFKLSIEKRSLKDALNEWARQTGYQVLTDINGDFAAPTIEGRLTPQEGLDRLLKGTPLTYRWMGERFVAISDKPPVVPAPQGTEQNSKPRSSATLARLAGDPLPPQAAGNDEPARSRGGQQSSSVPGRSRELPIQMEEILVTGTHIHGVTPVGSPVIVISRDEINSSGHARVQDILADLPQNFSGSAGEDIPGGGFDFGASNTTRGQSVDLRGLGASSTLVLVNGRRQPMGGTEGAFVDISSIAASAVERIEILTDGASALYGSDAIGGVVNFVLRKDYEGSETDLQLSTTDGAAEELRASQLFGHSWDNGHFLVGYEYLHRDALGWADTPYGALGGNMTTHGGSDFRLTAGNPGTILNPFTGAPAFAIPSGQNGVGLTVDDLIPRQANYHDSVTGADWTPEQTRHSVFLAMSYDVNDRFELFLDGRYSQRRSETSSPATPIVAFVTPGNPYFVDPFGIGFAIVLYSLDQLGFPQTMSDTDTYTLSAGASMNLSSQWKLNATGTFGREQNEVRADVLSDPMLQAALADSNPDTALNVFGAGADNNPATLDSLRATDIREGTSTLSSFTLIADGPLFRLPAGDVRAAIGFDYRDEQLDASFGILEHASGVFSRQVNSVGDIDRQVSAAFGELVFPVLSSGIDPRRSVLDVSLAARYEDYSDFGTTFDPKVGLSFMPLRGVTLRGSWGTSFRAPRLKELSPTANPSSAGGRSAFPDPQSPTGFSNVLFLGGGNPDLNEETADIWTAGLSLTPEPLPGLSLSLTYLNIDYKDKISIGGAGESTLLLEDQWSEIITRNPSQAQVDEVCQRPDFQAGTCFPNIAAIIDTRLRNLGVVKVRAVDLDLSYRFSSSLGDLSFGLAGTRTLDYERASSSTAPLFELVDTVNNTPALRLRGTIGWDLNRWRAAASLNYMGAYDDPANSARADSWLTVNPSVAYQFAPHGWLEGTRIQLSAINVFDERPPFVNTLVGFDMANASQVGRSVSLTINKQW